MSTKSFAWMLLAALAAILILLFNYWASYQPLSTLAYSGIVLALFGLANLALPFRFLGIRKRAIGALVFAGGVFLALSALLWPAPTIHVTERRTRLDEVMPEYQFNERHSSRVHANPEQVMQSIRDSTFGDMKSLGTLLKIRAAILRLHHSGSLQNKRLLDSCPHSGCVLESSEREVLVCAGANIKAQRPLAIHNLQEYVDDREIGAVKIAFDFTVEDAGGGWSTLSTETRVLATDDATRRGMARYWRLIVPGSGLLRRQWLGGIKRRAEMASKQS